MDFIKTVLFSLSVAGVLFWLGMIWKAEGDDKLSVACHPVEFGMGQLVVVTTGLVGYTPNWTIKAREVIEGGCYYFFSTFLFSGAQDIREPVDTGGGVYK